jgi:hypothetical protein
VALSHEAENLLGWLRDWSTAHRVRVAYSMPWMCVDPRDVTVIQRSNAAFLQQVAQYLPVLKDPHLGASTTREYFADTINHLTPEGSALRTDSLAQQLQAWDVWKNQELEILSTKLAGENQTAQTNQPAQSGLSEKLIQSK